MSREQTVSLGSVRDVRSDMTPLAAGLEDLTCEHAQLLAEPFIGARKKEIETGMPLEDLLWQHYMQRALRAIDSSSLTDEDTRSLIIEASRSARHNAMMAAAKYRFQARMLGKSATSVCYNRNTDGCMDCPLSGIMDFTYEEALRQLHSNNPTIDIFAAKIPVQQSRANDLEMEDCVTA